MSEVTQQRLRELFDYNPETGQFIFKPRPREEFHDFRASRVFESKCAGKTAGWRHGAGYTAIRVDGRDYLAHRLAWLYSHGEWPPHEIDHKNGDRSDNRLQNLRPATKKENSRNQCLRITNKSGVNGVIWDKRKGVWRADVTYNGRFIYLGQFKTIEEAAAARKAGERALGFHSGHGKQRVAIYKGRRRSGAAASPSVDAGNQQPDDAASYG